MKKLIYLLGFLFILSASQLSAQVFFLEKSNDAPDGGEATPGEIVEYTITFTANNVDGLSISDVLPPELEYQTGSLTIIGPDGNPLACNVIEPSGAGGTIDISCPSGNLITGEVNITYQVEVSNFGNPAVGLNQVLTNQVTVGGTVNGNNISVSDNSSIQVDYVSVQKSSNSITDQNVGDIVNYCISFQISDFANFSELLLTDVIPDGLELVVGSVTIIDENGNAVSPLIVPSVNTNSNGTTNLEFDLVSTYGGSNLSGLNGSICYDLLIEQNYVSNDPILANDILNNSVVGEYTLVEGGTGLDINNESITISDAIVEKTELSIGPYEPGDQVQFQLSLCLPSGDANNVTLTDVLPNGVFLTPTSADVSIDPSSDYNPAINFSTSGNNVILDFGDLTSTATDTQCLVINLNLTVDPASTLAGNQTNLLFASTQNSGGFTSQNTSGEIFSLGDAELEISKLAVDEMGQPLSGQTFDAGDAVNYQIAVSNIGNAPANNVVIADIASGLIDNCTVTDVQYDNNIGIPVPYTATGGMVEIMGSLNNANPSNPGFNTIIVELTCILGDDVVAGSQVPNDALVTYGQNSSTTSDPAFVDIAEPTIEKVVSSPSTGEVGVGELVQYTVTITIPEGSSPNVNFLDNLPGGMTFVSVDNIIPSTGLTTSLGAFPTTASSLNINFGDVSNNVSVNNGQDETIIIVYTVQIDANNSDGSSLTNTAAWNFDGNTITDTETVTVNLPDLAITKSMTGPVGDAVTIELCIENIEAVPAYNIEIDDILDPAIYDLASVTSTNIPTGYSFDASGVNITSDAGTSLDNSGPVCFEFTVKINPAETNCLNLISNTATLNAETAESGGNALPEEDVTETLNLPMLDVEKTVSMAPNGTFYEAGDVITYTITIVNNGSVDATNVDFSDAIPAGVTYVLGSASPMEDSFSGGVLDIALGTIPAGQTSTVTFDVEIDAFTDPITISNQAQVTSAEFATPVLSDDPTTNVGDSKDDDPTEFTMCLPPSISVSSTSACKEETGLCDPTCTLFAFDGQGEVDITINDPGVYSVSYQEWDVNSQSYGFSSASMVADANGNLTVNFSNLDDGLYLFTSTNTVDGCSGAICVIISEVNHTLVATPTTADCGGSNTLQLDASASIVDQVGYFCTDGVPQTIGGNSIVDYNWSALNPSNVSFDDATIPNPTLTFSGNQIGGYIIYLDVEDDFGCTHQQIFTINPPGITEILANDECIAGQTPEITATGGTAPWTFYLFNNGSPFNPGSELDSGVGVASSAGSVYTFTGLMQGTYTIWAQDSSVPQCPAISIDVNVYNPIAVTLNTAVCNYNVVTFDSPITGGFQPGFFSGATDYTVELVDASGTTIDSYTTTSATQDFPTSPGTIVSAGTYDVVITDDAGCEFTQSVQVLDEIEITTTFDACDYGDVDITVTGGTLNYQNYSVDVTDAGGTPVISNGSLNGIGSFQATIPDGVYTVTVTDDNGCIGSTPLTIAAPLELGIVPFSCASNSNEIELGNVSGGAGGYNITIDGTPASANSTISPLAEGTYEIVVTDADDCSRTYFVTVYDPLEIASVSTDCNFNTFDMTIIGGQPGLIGNGTAYQISSDIDGPLGNADNTGNFTAPTTLTADTHTITVSYNYTDSEGIQTTCSITTTVEIINEIELTINQSCTTFNEIDLETVSGGSGGNYTATLDNNGVQTSITSTGNTFSFGFPGIAEGTYDLYIEDNSGCRDTMQVEVYDPIDVQNTVVDCDYNTLNLTVTGGQPGHPNYSMTDVIVNSSIDSQLGNLMADGTFTATLSPGDHLITLTYNLVDADGNTIAVCTEDLPFESFQPIQLNTEYACYDGIQVQGGQGVLTYDLYTADGITLIDSNMDGIFSNTDGPYFLVVTDENGCSDSGEINCLPEIDCDAVDIAINTNCIGQGEFEVIFVIDEGQGDFTVEVESDLGDSETANGVSANDPFLTFGPYPTQTTLNFTVTSELLTTCVIVEEITRECFSCDLTLDDGPATCIDFDNYTVDIEIGGSGSYTVDYGTGTDTNVSAGTITYTYPSGSNQTITVFDPDRPDECTETINITGETCFTCDLTADDPQVNCISETEYEVEVTFSGTGTFSLTDGTTSYPNENSGTLTFGPYDNDETYNISIVSDVDATCTLPDFSGTQNCFECDLSIVVNAECNDDLLGYSVEVVVTGVLLMIFLKMGCWS